MARGRGRPWTIWSLTLMHVKPGKSYVSRVAVVVVLGRPQSRLPTVLSSEQPTVNLCVTFRTVAVVTGAAVDWLPLAGPTPLPCFVQHYEDRYVVKLDPNDSVGPLDYARA